MSKVGDITYNGRVGLFKHEWTVVTKKHRWGITSTIFHNYERARLFSQIVQMREELNSKNK